MNRKSVLGAGIEAFPVLIILVFIMALFITISMGASVFLEKPETKKLSFTPVEENLLLQTVKFKMKDNTEREMIVLDAAKALMINKIDANNFAAALETLREGNKCYFLGLKDLSIQYATSVQFGPGPEKNLQVLVVDNLMLGYYYGPC